MERQRKNLIFLTGFMGSGKSTIAPILANTLGYEYVDIDAEIEKLTGKKVSEIFSEHGEEYFRDVERTLLQEVSRRHGCVVSLGGGTIANENNLKIIKSSGLLIYLKTNADQIFRRLRHKSDRPLLKTAEGERLNEPDLRDRIQKLLITREPFYNQSDFIIQTDESPVGKTVDAIVRTIKSSIE